VSILSCSDGGRSRGVSCGDRGPETWHDDAACLGYDPELFFPIGTTSPYALAQIAEAKAVCAVCPVRTACLEWALGRGPDGRVRAGYGVFGGLDEDEREALLRREARVRRAGRAGVAA
jgi:WhiB family transcriptional regulator, redox-sensing transcriptional regulator